MRTKKNPPPAGTGIAGHDKALAEDSTTRPLKIHRVLRALASGRSFNRFEAERDLHDHCLHSTVSSIQRQYGLHIYRVMETVMGFEGLPTRVCRYRLLPADLASARELLGMPDGGHE